MLDEAGTLIFRVVADGKVLDEATVSDTWPEETIEASSRHQEAIARAALATGHKVHLESRNLDGTLFDVIELDEGLLG